MAVGDSVSGESPADFNMEFRCFDDSWYSVRAILDGEALTIKYANFSDAADERFVPGYFATLDEVHRFRRRFRPVSVQLQDNECSTVAPGTAVCACHSYNGDDARFHDAVVEDVKFVKHSFINGEEECRCIFMLSWLHGPKVGSLTTTNIENICIIQSSDEVDPPVASFLNIVMEKIEMTSLNSGSSSAGVLSTSRNEACHERIYHSIVGNKSSLESGGTKCLGQFSSTLLMSEEKNSICWIETEQDIDMGGEADHTEHFILLNNLEKDLSSKTVVEFIYNQTAITTEACIFPSLPSETYTRGIIGLDCWENLEKVYKFLDNPNCIIISSAGRPWVIAEKISKHGLLRMPAVNMTQISQRNFEGTCAGNGSKLKVTCTGTPEYSKAKKLRDLFMEFSDHQQGLHKRLALEERKISQMCCASQVPQQGMLKAL